MTIKKKEMVRIKEGLDKGRLGVATEDAFASAFLTMICRVQLWDDSIRGDTSYKVFELDSLEVVNMDDQLIRPLAPGDSFLVMDKLMVSFNDRMNAYQGSWLTVQEKLPREGRQTTYIASEVHAWQWGAYHMDIAATNDYLRRKSLPERKETPALPHL